MQLLQVEVGNMIHGSPHKGDQAMPLGYKTLSKKQLENEIF